MTDDDGGCEEPDNTVLQWALFGIFLLLSFLSSFIVKLVFNGLLAVIKIKKVDSALHSQLLVPTTFLVSLGFFMLAFFTYFPWPCELVWLENTVFTICRILILVGAFLLIQRAFSFAEMVLEIFRLPSRLEPAVYEGLGVVQMIVMVIVGLLFFVDIVSLLFGGSSHATDGGGGSFSPHTFLSEINLVTQALCFVLVPFLRDASGGLFLLFTQPFDTGDELMLDGKRGRVDRIGLFAVVLKDSFTGMVMLVPGSRFIEKEFTILSSHGSNRRRRKRAVRFMLDAGDSSCGVSRTLLIDLEAVLRERECTEVSVTVAMNHTPHSTSAMLDVQFNLPAHKLGQQREINLAKLALVDRVRSNTN